MNKNIDDSLNASQWVGYDRDDNCNLCKKAKYVSFYNIV